MMCCPLRFRPPLEFIFILITSEREPRAGPTAPREQRADGAVNKLPRPDEVTFIGGKNYVLKKMKNEKLK